MTALYLYDEVIFLNYIRKIDKLNKRIKVLEEENKRLEAIIKDIDRVKQKCEFQTKLAEQKEQEFQKLIIELEDEKEKYRTLIQKIRIAKKKIEGDYDKAVKTIKKNIQKK